MMAMHRTPSRRPRGFTLVELMVTLALGLFIALGLAQVFASSNESYDSLSQAAQQIENGRFAVQTLENDLKHAGYYGQYGFTAMAGSTLPNPCEKSNLTAVRDALAFHVQGYDAPGSSPLSCIDDANLVPGTDIIVVRRASTLTTAPGALVVNELYMQATADSTNAANPVLALGQDSSEFSLLRKDAATPAEIRKFLVRIYFVSPCSMPASGTTCTAAADGGRPIPTLKRLELAVNPSSGALEMQTQSIAEGIENLQLDYGIDADGDGVPDAASVSAPGNVADWANVTIAQVHVLVRNIKATPGHVDSKTYDLGVAGSVTPGDNFRRHAFTAQVRMVNPAGRREIP
ncbi:MAG: PilW family protein [Burkholderiales bacterium]